MIVRRLRTGILRVRLADGGMLALVAVRIVVPRVVDELADLCRFHGINFADIVAQDNSAREQERAGVVLISGGIVAVGEEIPQALPAREPVLVKRGDCEYIRNVDLLDEL